jgi:hypothetical protein
MNVFLWVAALRIVAGVLIVSLVFPNLLKPWRWAQPSTRRAMR